MRSLKTHKQMPSKLRKKSIRPERQWSQDQFLPLCCWFLFCFHKESMWCQYWQFYVLVKNFKWSLSSHCLNLCTWHKACSTSVRIFCSNYDEFFFIDNHYETIYSSFQKWVFFVQGVEVMEFYIYMDHYSICKYVRSKSLHRDLPTRFLPKHSMEGRTWFTGK